MTLARLPIKHFLNLLGIIALLHCAAATATATDDNHVLQVKYIGNNHHVNEQYYLALIAAALDITKSSHGPYHIQYSEQALTSERKHELLVAGESLNIDRLVGFPIVRGPRAKLLRVDAPILQGAMGYRVLLIHKEKQALFDSIFSLEQLSALPMGFGRGWESHVYTHNQFHVTESLNMTSLLKMLAGQRYAFVPLGIIEIEDSYQLEGKQANNLVIENNLLLYMPLPVYFYVSPNAPKLAERLQMGLHALNKSGVMDKLFREHFGSRLARLNLSKRRLIELENPDKSSNYIEQTHDWLKNY